MTINITSGSSGWGNYVLYGTNEKPRDNEKVELLEGDIALGDRLSQSNNYEESYYKIVLAFEGKPDDETIKSAYEDFKKEFFVGFKRDEYHIDAVVHKDTDNYHIHCRVPKQNLLTDTHLQLYMDKIDRPRKELIQDHISLKYGFNIAREQNREIFKEEAHEQINKWREQHNQKPFDFKSKEGKAEAEAQINGYLSELIKTGLIEKREDITATLQELGLKVEKENGLDLKKDFAYTTVSNETGKLRIKGEIHHDRFYTHNQKDRSSQIDHNQRIIAEREPNQERIKTVRRELNKANEKRFNKVTNLFKSARARAEREHSKTLETGRVESLNNSKHNKLNDRNISNNVANKSNEFKGNSKLHKRENNRSEGRAKLSQIQSKRVNLRPTKTSILLQTKLKEKTNDKHTRQTIERIRSTREAQSIINERARIIRETQSRAIQQNSGARQALSSRVREFKQQLQQGIRKLEIINGKIREKVVNKFNEAKERFNKKLEAIDNRLSKEKDFGKLDKSNELDKVLERYEKAQTPDKSEALKINKPEVKELDKAPKKRSLQRQR